MSDKELMMEIFKRLGYNFVNLNSPIIAMTDSEVASDALEETLFNIGLDGLYEKIDTIDSYGIWYAKFNVK